MTIMINIGRWGGIYLCRGRLCLGWIALTIKPYDIDARLAAAVRENKCNTRWLACYKGALEHIAKGEQQPYYTPAHTARHALDGFTITNLEDQP